MAINKFIAIPNTISPFKYNINETEFAKFYIYASRVQYILQWYWFISKYYRGKKFCSYISTFKWQVQAGTGFEIYIYCNFDAYIRAQK